MKKYVLLLAAISLSWSVSAQKVEKQFIPQEGDFGVVFNVAGLIANINVAPTTDPMGNTIILGKYFVRDQHLVRMGIGMKSYNVKNSFVDSLGSFKRTYDSTYKKFNFYLSPGYEYHFQGIKRLDPYIGGGLNFGFLGKTNQQVDLSLQDTTGTDKEQTTYTKDGGFMLGINAIVGFNYFVAPNLSLGAEYNLGYYWQRDGGDWERVTVSNPVSGNSRSRRELGSDRTVNSGFDFSNNLSITLSYYFGRKEEQ